MTVYAVSAELRGVIFDIDRTLYSGEAYPEHQYSALFQKLAEHRNSSVDEARALVHDVRQRWALDHGGRRPSLGNAFLSLGVPIEQSVRWRKETFCPEAYLSRDPKLRNALQRLARRYRLATVTNNPSAIGIRALGALGVRDLLPVVIGLDTSGVSKPHRKPFEMACSRMQLPCREVVSVGDRYEVDLEAPLSMGMGGILVTGVEDVYRIVEEQVVPC